MRTATRTAIFTLHGNSKMFLTNASGCGLRGIEKCVKDVFVIFCHSVYVKTTAHISKNYKNKGVVLKVLRNAVYSR